MKKSEARLPMNMMNKCAKFHKEIVQAIKKKGKFNLPSTIELSKMAVFVYNFV